MFELAHKKIKKIAMHVTNHTRPRGYGTFHRSDVDLTSDFIYWNVNNFYTEVLAGLQYAKTFVNNMTA